MNGNAACGRPVFNMLARKTIPVPMVVGHEFVGEVVRIGSNVEIFIPARS